MSVCAKAICGFHFISLILFNRSTLFFESSKVPTWFKPLLRGAEGDEAILCRWTVIYGR